MEVQCK